MAFLDWEDDPTLGKESCPTEWRIHVHCPNWKLVDSDMTGEWWKCEKCNRTKYADYEDMR